MLASDGVHLSPAGNRVLFEGVTAAVDARYPQFKPYSLPLHFPVHDTVNAGNPGATFDALLGYSVRRDASLPPLPAQKAG